jgi:hypothetical protein
MFRSIQDRFTRRLQTIRSKNQSQTEVEKSIRLFLIQQFGPIGETLNFKVSQENKKINLHLENKTAVNEIIIRSGKLKEWLKTYDKKIETINIY